MRLNLKLVAIFIIAIYCLSPLAAVDFSHDNANETDHIDKSIDNNEKTIKNDADDSKDSKDPQDNKLEAVAENQTKGRNAKELSSLNLKATAQDYKQGDEGTLLIQHDNTNTIEVTCEVKGDNYDDTQKIKLSADQKSTEVKLSKNLKPGNYTVKVSYDGDDSYLAAEASTTFKVTGLGKLPTNLGVSAVSNEANKVTVNVTANTLLSGEVNVTLNGSDTVHPVNVQMGNGQITISDVAPGNYTVAAKFGGNDDFDPANATTTVSVKDRLNLRVDAVGGEYTDGAKINVRTPNDPNFSGTVDVKIDKKLYSSMEIVNGQGNITIHDLEAGNHKVQVSFSGDDKYGPTETATYVIITKSDSNMTMHIDDVYKGEKPTIVIHANKAMKDYVLVNIYAKNYETSEVVYVENGYGTTTIEGELPAGQCTAEIKYTSYKFTDANVTTNFKVRGNIDPNFTIDVKDIKEGQKAVAQIHADKSFNGNVTLHLNDYGADYNVQLKDGYANYTIDWNFTARDNNVVSVIFNGDDTYKAGEARTSFSVYPADVLDPDLKVHVDDIMVYENCKVDITANETFTGDVSIEVDGDTSLTYTLHVKNGKGSDSYETKNFPAGKHSIRAYVGAAQGRMPSEDTAYFTIHKYDSNLTISANDSYVDDNVVIEAHGANNFTPTIQVQLNGTNHHNRDGTYLVYMYYGYGKSNYGHAFPADNYTLSVSYPGNDKYNSSEANATFEVKKHPLDLNLKTEHCVENQQCYVEITCDKSFSGDVKLNINGTESNVTMQNGWHKVPIGKLSQGKYNASVSFEGNEKYLPDQDSKTFIVYPASAKDSGLKMWFGRGEVYEGEPARLTISACQEFNETVQVKLDDGRVFDVHLEDGKEVTNSIKHFTPGQHTATINYEGNGTFKPCDVSASVLVKEKLDPNITASANNIVDGEKAVVEFHADSNFSGYITYRLNDYITSSNDVEIVDGYANVTFDDLTPGDYEVSYEFAGDFDHKACKGTVSFNVAPKYDPDLAIVVNDVTYGQDAVARVYANETLSGNASITLNGSDAVYPVKISEGYGSTTLKDLNASNYTATVSYPGDNTTFHPANKSTTFKVKKVSTAISVDVDNVTGGDSAMAYIHLNKPLSDDVKVKLDGSSSKTVKLTNGEGNVTLNNLTHGNHTVKATFEGNNNYDKAENSKTFSVNKNDPKLDVSADSVKIGQDAKVLITTDKSYTGKVDVQIGSNSSTVDIEDGQAEITLKDLKVANYTVKAKINESSTFKSDEKTVNFSVSKYNPDLDIKVEDTFLHDTAKAVVTTNKTFSGNVTVEVEGVTYNAPVTNGEGSVELNALPGGSHEAKATFEETALFEAAEKTTTFNIFKFDPDLNVKVDNITLGEDAHVEITANSFITDTVLVEIGVATYKVNITNGYGSLDVPGLKVGGYDVKVIYDGDDWFSPANKTAHFSVNKFDPNLDVRVSNINVGEDAIVAVTTAKDFSGNVKVQVADKNYNVTVTDGQGSVKVSGLAAGNYNVKVTFEETAKYKAGEKTATFSVNKFDPNLKVSVSSVRQSEKPVVTVTTDSKFSGNVNVKVDSTNYVVSVANGKGTKTISSLKKGTHKATATFAETPMFKSATKSVSFNVKDDTVKLVLKKTKIKKSAKKATLQATLKINGKAVKGKVVKFTFKGKTYKAKTNAKGIAKVTIKKSVLKKLKVGKKVIYKAIYSPKTVKKTVKVLK